MTRLPTPSALVFDWDNTLVDSWVCIRETYNATFRHFGMPLWTMEETRTHVAASMRDSFPMMFGERWEEAREVFTTTFRSIHLDHLAPLPGAPALLERLRDRGLPLAVVSNKRGPFLRKEADVLGWTGYFCGLVGADDAHADKPDPAPVHMALAPSGVAVSPAVWFVGDSPIDIECAVKCGCTAVLMRPEPPRPGEFSYPPAQILTSCEALAALLDEV